MQEEDCERGVGCEALWDGAVSGGLVSGEMLGVLMVWIGL
jgi:hypothetical protein